MPSTDVVSPVAVQHIDTDSTDTPAAVRRSTRSRSRAGSVEPLLLVQQLSGDKASSARRRETRSKSRGISVDPEKPTRDDNAVSSARAAANQFDLDFDVDVLDGGDDEPDFDSWLSAQDGNDDGSEKKSASSAEAGSEATAALKADQVDSAVSKPTDIPVSHPPTPPTGTDGISPQPHESSSVIDVASSAASIATSADALAFGRTVSHADTDLSSVASAQASLDPSADARAHDDTRDDSASPIKRTRLSSISAVATSPIGAETNLGAVAGDESDGHDDLFGFSFDNDDNEQEGPSVKTSVENVMSTSINAGKESSVEDSQGATLCSGSDTSCHALTGCFKLLTGRNDLNITAGPLGEIPTVEEELEKAVVHDLTDIEEVAEEHEGDKAATDEAKGTKVEPGPAEKAKPAPAVGEPANAPTPASAAMAAVAASSPVSASSSSTKAVPPPLSAQKRPSTLGAGPSGLTMPPSLQAMTPKDVRRRFNSHKVACVLTLNVELIKIGSELQAQQPIDVTEFKPLTQRLNSNLSYLAQMADQFHRRDNARAAPPPPILEAPPTPMLGPRLMASYQTLKGYFAAADRYEKQSGALTQMALIPSTAAVQQSQSAPAPIAMPLAATLPPTQQALALPPTIVPTAAQTQEQRPPATASSAKRERDEVQAIGEAAESPAKKGRVVKKEEPVAQVPLTQGRPTAAQPSPFKTSANAAQFQAPPPSLVQPPQPQPPPAPSQQNDGTASYPTPSSAAQASSPSFASNYAGSAYTVNAGPSSRSSTPASSQPYARQQQPPPMNALPPHMQSQQSPAHQHQQLNPQQQMMLRQQQLAGMQTQQQSTMGQQQPQQQQRYTQQQQSRPQQQQQQLQQQLPQQQQVFMQQGQPPQQRSQTPQLAGTPRQSAQPLPQQMMMGQPPRPGSAIGQQNHVASPASYSGSPAFANANLPPPAPQQQQQQYMQGGQPGQPNSLSVAEQYTSVQNIIQAPTFRNLPPPLQDQLRNQAQGLLFQLQAASVSNARNAGIGASPGPGRVMSPAVGQHPGPSPSPHQRMPPGYSQSPQLQHGQIRQASGGYSSSMVGSPASSNGAMLPHQQQSMPPPQGTDSSAAFLREQ